MPDTAPGAVGAAPAVVTSGLSRTYRTLSGAVTALEPSSLEVPAGRLAVVAGPSGSGKSTLLRLCAGLDRPTTGSVVVGRDRVELTRMGARRRRRWRREQVGYVFQRPTDNLLRELTAREHLGLAARLRGAAPDPAEEDALLALAGLTARAGQRPTTLSGGEQQRLAVLAAVVGSPALVVADEPTAELDGANGRAVLDLLGALAARGASVLVSSHDRDALAAADWVAHLEHGRLVSAGTPRG